MAKVLVIDDEQSIRTLMAAILEDEGHEVIQAADGHQGLDLLDTETPDIVILDIMMPGIDGRETYRQIRERPHLDNVPVIMVSAGAYGAPESVNAFMRKPFNLGEFLATLDRVLAVS